MMNRPVYRNFCGIMWLTTCNGSGPHQLIAVNPQVRKPRESSGSRFMIRVYTVSMVMMRP